MKVHLRNLAQSLHWMHLVLFIFIQSFPTSSAFTSLNRDQVRPQYTFVCNAGFENNQSNQNSSAGSEYEQMKGILDAMEAQDVPSRYLQKEQREIIENLVRKVVKERPSAVPLKAIQQTLPGSQWKLRFSTETATLSDLPKDANVKLHFLNDKQLYYILEFSAKTLGLQRLVAKSSYSVDSTDTNPGLVTFVYDQIVTDVWGLKNIGVGFFGLLRGRMNYVESVYMDASYWIERGYTAQGNQYFNVYVRQLDAQDSTEPQKQTQSAASPSTSVPLLDRDDQWD